MSTLVTWTTFGGEEPLSLNDFWRLLMALVPFCRLPGGLGHPWRLSLPELGRAPQGAIGERGVQDGVQNSPRYRLLARLLSSFLSTPWGTRETPAKTGGYRFSATRYRPSFRPLPERSRTGRIDFLNRVPLVRLQPGPPTFSARTALKSRQPRSCSEILGHPQAFSSSANIAAAAVRFGAPSFRRMCSTCFSTVLIPACRTVAISRFVRPRASKGAICASRGVRSA